MNGSMGSVIKANQVIEVLFLILSLTLILINFFLSISGVQILKERREGFGSNSTYHPYGSDGIRTPSPGSFESTGNMAI